MWGCCSVYECEKYTQIGRFLFAETCFLLTFPCFCHFSYYVCVQGTYIGGAKVDDYVTQLTISNYTDKQLLCDVGHRYIYSVELM